MAAISLGIVSLNFDAVALFRDDSVPKSDEGERCRNEVCARFVGCVDSDRRGQLKTDKDQCTEVHEDRLKECEKKKDPQDPLWTRKNGGSGGGPSRCRNPHLAPAGCTLPPIKGSWGPRTTLEHPR